MSEVNQWQWFGHAGHLCVAADCRFHLCTLVGGWLVSTVGDYRPRHKGDCGAMERIGAGAESFFETYVFKVIEGSRCSDPECECGLPNIDGSEIDGERYAKAGDAADGHMRYCQKYTALSLARPQEGEAP
jgi:hypothetical protein